MNCDVAHLVHTWTKSVPGISVTHGVISRGRRGCACALITFARTECWISPPARHHLSLIPVAGEAGKPVSSTYVQSNRLACSALSHAISSTVLTPQSQDACRLAEWDAMARAAASAPLLLAPPGGRRERSPLRRLGPPVDQLARLGPWASHRATCAPSACMFACVSSLADRPSSHRQVLEQLADRVPCAGQ